MDWCVTSGRCGHPREYTLPACKILISSSRDRVEWPTVNSDLAVGKGENAFTS